MYKILVLTVMLFSIIIVCGVFRINVTGGVRRCKGVGTLKTAGGRVGRLVFERNVFLAVSSVPIKLLLNFLVTGYNFG